MAEPFRHRFEGRNRRTAGVLAAVYVGLGLLFVTLHASPWILGALALTTLPALWELWKNPVATLTLDDRGLNWQMGRHGDTLPLARIDHVRMDTRLDFSVRVTPVLTSGQKWRIPVQCQPPHRAFEAALKSHGIDTRRHHFSLLG